VSYRSLALESLRFSIAATRLRIQSTQNQPNDVDREVGACDTETSP
jgi:hypothetical protein